MLKPLRLQTPLPYPLRRPSLLFPAYVSPPSAVRQRSNTASGPISVVPNSAQIYIRLEILAVCCLPERGSFAHRQHPDRYDLPLKQFPGEMGAQFKRTSKTYQKYES